MERQARYQRFLKKLVAHGYKEISPFLLLSYANIEFKVKDASKHIKNMVKLKYIHLDNAKWMGGQVGPQVYVIDYCK